MTLQDAASASECLQSFATLDHTLLLEHHNLDFLACLHELPFLLTAIHNSTVSAPKVFNIFSVTRGTTGLAFGPGTCGSSLIRTYDAVIPDSCLKAFIIKCQDIEGNAVAS